MMKHLAIRFVIITTLLILGAAARADYIQSWDDDHGEWTYWVSQTNEPYLTHDGTGGVADSGYVSVDLDDVVEFHEYGLPLEWVYFPAYLYPEEAGIGRFDFTGAGAGVSVYLGGTDINLQSGQLYFYLARAEPTDRWTLYRHNTPLLIGSGSFELNTLALDSEAANWTLIEGGGGNFTIAEVMASATEFGFSITGVPNGPNPTGILRLDEFSTTATIVPEPSMLILLGLLALGGAALLRRG